MKSVKLSIADQHYTELCQLGESGILWFLEPNPDCMVECLKSCCSDLSPPWFPPIRSGDYVRERVNTAYSS
ncbi:hypothetical protein L1987_76488 [Smallanthus sonchifolius]|uniref:Uncharacterized protein n=1 Tax=Smallanthus sonchifolius TaxID=185202 RepID=A0ACB8Z870_9ASTR|nr:hypothetical protein L1987_76488 [Smallanthus sonchifolius]